MRVLGTECGMQEQTQEKEKGQGGEKKEGEGTVARKDTVNEEEDEDDQTEQGDEKDKHEQEGGAERRREDDQGERGGSTRRLGGGETRRKEGGGSTRVGGGGGSDRGDDADASDGVAEVVDADGSGAGDDVSSYDVARLNERRRGGCKEHTGLRGIQREAERGRRRERSKVIMGIKKGESGGRREGRC
eukprot:249298-Hanusia_phi.AAC.1